MMDGLREKIAAGSRIAGEEAVRLQRDADILTLGLLADEVRRRKHPEGNVTYVIDRNINYTDVCASGCKFCAFHKAPGAPGGYVLDRETLFAKIRETRELGGRQIMLQGGLHPDLGIEYYEGLLSDIRENFPDFWIHALSPPEIAHIGKVSALPVEEVILRLRQKGLDSIPGGGAEILVDRVRREISPRKCGAGEWLSVMRAAHKMGMRTTATMMYGHVETPEERVEHLLRLRELQDETGGFTAFIPWPFQPRNTGLALEENDGASYLRTLALSRIVLDNFDNVQASWVTQGSKMAQASLFFGANDMGSTMIEENVVRAAGVCFRLSEREIVEMIEGAGFRAVRRDMLYRPVR